MITAGRLSLELQKGRCPTIDLVLFMSLSGLHKNSAYMSTSNIKLLRSKDTIIRRKLCDGVSVSGRF
jgi:hypothetical protein